MLTKTKQKLKTFGVSILIAELVGGLSALLTRTGTKMFETIPKPDITPPALIYMSLPSVNKNHSIIIYVCQLLVNFFWSIIFFNFQAYGFAFIWILLLLALIILMIYKFYQVNKFAALLQIPYLIWVAFATYLTFNIWILNK